jgi:RNA polymerase sigma-70 factor, ECF subfamily
VELDMDREASQQMSSLLRQASDNDREALDEIFTRYRRQLYNRALHVMGNAEDAEDALQDGLLAATRHLKSFEGRSQLSTWLTRIVFNAALMRLRKIRGHTTTSIDQESPDERGLSLAAQIADPRPDPEEAYAREERLTMVRQWLRTLPASQRSALWLRDVEGMTTQEAAEALRVSEGTLKSRLHRARLELSRRLHEPARTRIRVGQACKQPAKRTYSTGIYPSAAQGG